MQHIRDAPAHNDSDESTEYEYYDDSSSEAHSDDSDDEGTGYCEGCNRIFVDKASLYQHLVDSAKHNWCFACSRDFATPGGLENVSITAYLGRLK